MLRLPLASLLPVSLAATPVASVLRHNCCFGCCYCSACHTQLKYVITRAMGKLIALCTYVLWGVLPVLVLHTPVCVRVPRIIWRQPLALLFPLQINGCPMYHMTRRLYAVAVNMVVAVGLRAFPPPFHMRCWCCPLVHCCTATAVLLHNVFFFCYTQRHTMAVH